MLGGHGEGLGGAGGIRKGTGLLSRVLGGHTEGRGAAGGAQGRSGGCWGVGSVLGGHRKRLEGAGGIREGTEVLSRVLEGRRGHRGGR